jgi:hypothetical protein
MPLLSNWWLLVSCKVFLVLHDMKTLSKRCRSKAVSLTARPSYLSDALQRRIIDKRLADVRLQPRNCQLPRNHLLSSTSDWLNADTRHRPVLISLLFTIIRGAHIFQKSRRLLNFLGARRVTYRRFRTEDPCTFGTTVKNLAATVTWYPEFVNLSISSSSSSCKVTLSHRV